MNTIQSGLDHFFEGFKLIAKPGLRRFVVVPMCLNMLLFTGMFLLAKYYMGEFNHWLDGYLPNWLHWLQVVFWLVFVVSFFAVMVYTFVTVANIVCAPFNAFLAEKVELHLTGLPGYARHDGGVTRTFLAIVKDIPRSFFRQVSIVGYYIPRALLLFCLLFVPVVQAMVGIAWLLFHAWFLTMTYSDYPTDNHRVSLRVTREWMGGRRWVVLGFGAGVLVASMVPVVNFFTIPAAVAGATRFWLKENGQCMN